MHILRSKYVTLACALMACAAARGATINTTLTVNGTVTASTTITASGKANLTSIGDGTFNATVSLTAITGTTVNAPYTITLTSGDTLTGTLSVPLSLFLGSATSGTGSATVTGGTGAYSGATGSFPSLTGTGSATSGTAATFTFTGAGTITTGGTPAPPTPTISLVGDAATYSKTLAQGSLFVIKGSNLSPSGFFQNGYPLPTTFTSGSNTVRVTFTPTSGGSGTQPYLVYLLNQSGVNQIAAVLPSTLATGSYNVTVTSNGTASAPVAVTVVQRRFQFFTQDASGTGLAIAQNFISASQLDFNRFTTGSLSTGYTISPAKPGQVLIAWGTGMGPVSGGDNQASPGFNFAANGVNVQVLVGGEAIAPAYAGRAPGFSGEDQINFQLPADVPTGCTVSFQVSVNGVLSSPTFIAIAPTPSASACVSPFFTPDQLANFDQGQQYTVGAFELLHTTVTAPSVGTATIDTANGAFTQYTGFQLAAIPPSAASVTTSGACQVTQLTGATTPGLPTGTGTNLDAGTVTLNGPSGSNISNLALTESLNVYSASIGAQGLPVTPPGTGNGKIVAGTYTLAGAGGKDVGKFNASLTLGTPLTITGGLPSVVNRSADLTLNWTGGSSTDFVEIVGTAETSSGTPPTLSGAAFLCITTAGPGTFTVPKSILSQLPAVTAGATGTSSALVVLSGPSPASGNGLFTAPLTAGGSVNSTFLGLQGISAQVSYQ